MRADTQLVEPYRVREGRMGSDDSYGHNGLFLVPRANGVTLQIIASDGMEWDHVSVVPIDSRSQRKLYRCPTWEEMCAVKDLFFAHHECVVQFHPPRADYRNAHEYCLHLWRPQGVVLPLPDPEMVAPAPSAILAGSSGAGAAGGTP